MGRKIQDFTTSVGANAFWSFLLVLGSGASGAVAVWLRSLTEFQQGVFCTLSAVLLLLAIGIAIRLMLRRRNVLNASPILSESISAAGDGDTAGVATFPAAENTSEVPPVIGPTFTILPPKPWPPPPEDGILHDFITEETLEKLRTTTGVSLIAPVQNQLTLRELPGGIYGYSDLGEIHVPLSSLAGFFYPVGMVPPVRDEDWLLVQDSLTLRRRQVLGLLRGDIEVHKATSGCVYVVAFVPSEAFLLLTRPNLPVDTKVPTILRLTPRTTGDHLIAIPRERLCSWRPRSLENGEWIVDATLR